MKILVALMVLAPLGLAQTVLFEDDFSDGNADGWTEMVTGATYLVNSALRYEMSYYGSDSTYAFTCNGDGGTTMSDSNYSVLFQVIAYSPTKHIGINIRYMESTGSSYALYLNFHSNYYIIIRYDSFLSSTELGSSVYYSEGFDYQTPYWVRFECYGDILRAKIWEGSSTPEPENWMIVRIDDNYVNNGCIALECLNYTSMDYLVEFDNVVVTTVVPGTLENTTWGAIKSAF